MMPQKHIDNYEYSCTNPLLNLPGKLKVISTDTVVGIGSGWYKAAIQRKRLVPQNRAFTPPGPEDLENDARQKALSGPPVHVNIAILQLARRL